MQRMVEKIKFPTLLRKSGYKATPSRLAVLSLLEKTKGPMSAQDVVNAIGKTMDQATVYRIFKDLKTKGIIRPIDLRHNHAHYELANLKEHHHLICTHCGRMEDVHECGADEMEGVILRHSKHFSKVTQHSLEFYGICKSCAKKQP